MNKRLKLLDRSEESDYWLGYLAADGCIINNPKHRNYTINLFSVDNEIKVKYQNYWNNDINYHYRKKSKLHQLYFSNLELVKELTKIGITPRKSLTLKLNLPLNNHIVRGIFDGDGWVRAASTPKKYESKITTGSIFLLEQLKTYFNSHKVEYKVKQKGNAFDINFYKKSESYKFYKLIYKDANIYMERKYNKFVALFGNKDDENSVNSEKLQKMDNPEPSSPNGIKVSEKVQRLTSEEPTNKLDTSAELLYQTPSEHLKTEVFIKKII